MDGGLTWLCVGPAYDENSMAGGSRGQRVCPGAIATGWREGGIRETKYRGEFNLYGSKIRRCVCTRAKEYHSHKIRTLMPAELSFISIVPRPGEHRRARQGPGDRTFPIHSIRASQFRE